ncbi:MAG: hypothetical protein IPL46_28815 [Saprospiraceae bacterium]|nr:hypothetical protein [Saprospiraceae bacterium]
MNSFPWLNMIKLVASLLILLVSSGAQGQEVELWEINDLPYGQLKSDSC